MTDTGAPPLASASGPDPAIAQAILNLLDELGQPLTSAKIADLLRNSGISVAGSTVLAVLQGALAGKVERDRSGAWRLLPGILDEDQQRVADAPIEDRMLVIAGPGAGKTEVACARVAAARKKGLPARAIVIVSYTRAATAEVRGRLERYGRRMAISVRGVEIRTLDSLSWTLQRHLVDGDVLTGSYADNIERMKTLLENPPCELVEYLQGIKLLILDESQDIVGRRSDLGLLLIRSLPDRTGITVFADPAQAIYGDWAIEEGRRLEDAPPLNERLERGEAGSFRAERLRGSHRTSNPELQNIAAELRRFVLIRNISEEAAYKGVKDGLAAQTAPVSRLHDLAGLAMLNTSQFFLFRTHGDVAILSSYLSPGTRHRLRYPGLPRPVFPWIGRLLFLGADRRLRRSEFNRLWQERVASTPFAKDSTADGAWDTLLAVAGDPDLRYVDTVHLREILSRRNPPDEVLRPTLGAVGPVLGTVHGAKGREAEDVVLAVTPLRDGTDRREEARVLYVGATRARTRLRVAEVSSRAFYLPSRRAWRLVQNDGAQFEFGLERDIDPLSPVSLRLGSDSDARQRQDALAAMAGVDAVAEWTSRRPATLGGDWSRVITAGEYGDIASCGPLLDRDLWEIANRVGGRRRPPDVQRHLYVVDFTTVARDDDSADLNALTRTFAKSGFWVSPLVKGFSPVYPRRTR